MPRKAEPCAPRALQCPWELLFVSTWLTYPCQLRVLLAPTASWKCCCLEQPMFVTFWFFFNFILLFPFFLSWASSLGCKNAVYFPKLPSLSLEMPCFCKAIWMGSLQIPRAQGWLPACPCRAPAPEMDLSPFPPSAFLPF